MLLLNTNADPVPLLDVQPLVFGRAGQFGGSGSDVGRWIGGRDPEVFLAFAVAVEFC